MLMELVFLLEELSAKRLLEGLFPRLVPGVAIQMSSTLKAQTTHLLTLSADGLPVFSSRCKIYIFSKAEQ